jgi:hypothetical protein
VIVFINWPLDYEVLPVEPQFHYREPHLEPVVNLLFSATHGQSSMTHHSFTGLHCPCVRGEGHRVPHESTSIRFG